MLVVDAALYGFFRIFGGYLKPELYLPKGGITVLLAWKRADDLSLRGFLYQNLPKTSTRSKTTLKILYLFTFLFLVSKSQIYVRTFTTTMCR